jgi:undecaprenyl diphosphate synthase
MNGSLAVLLLLVVGLVVLLEQVLAEVARGKLIFTDTMWPDFDERDLESALDEFSCRERRFGGVPTIVLNSGSDRWAASRDRPR